MGIGQLELLEQRKGLHPDPRIGLLRGMIAELAKIQILKLITQRDTGDHDILSQISGLCDFWLQPSAL